MSTTDKNMKSVTELVARLSERLDRLTNKSRSEFLESEVKLAQSEIKYLKKVAADETFARVQVEKEIGHALRTTEDRVLLVLQKINERLAAVESKVGFVEIAQRDNAKVVNNYADRTKVVEGQTAMLSEVAANNNERISEAHGLANASWQHMVGIEKRVDSLEQQVKRDFRKALPMIISFLLDKPFSEKQSASGYKFDISKEVVNAVQELVDEARDLG